MAAKSPYPAELRKRAVRMVAEVRPDYSTEWAEEVKRLRRENAELRRANEILKAASAFFA